MLFGMLDEQEKTLSKGSSAYLLAPVCAGASRQCCDATQTGRMSHLEDLKSWTRHAWFRRGVIEEIGRYVEGRDGAGETRDPRDTRIMQNSTVNRRQRSCRITLLPLS